MRGYRLGFFMTSAGHLYKTLIFAGAAMITACGGGGGSSAATAPPPSTPPVSTPMPADPALSFSQRTNESGLVHVSMFSDSLNKDPRFFGGGAASGDIDNDGDIDLFIARGDSLPNLLYMNDGGVFTDRAQPNIALPNNGTKNYKLSGPSFADIDGDNNLDLFVGGLDGDPSFVFKGNGDGTFTDVTAGSGIDGMSAFNTLSSALGDYDNDGDLDLVLAHWGTPRDATAPGDTETLWRNDSAAGVIIFTSVSEPSGVAAALALNLNGVLGPNHDYTFSPNFADINGDGWMDILNVSDFRGSGLFINNQDGTFSDVTDRTQINDNNGMGSAVADYDNDGDMDWFVSSVDGNRLYNNMDGILIDDTARAGIAFGGWGWGSCFADFNADGQLDIYQTNGWINNNGGNPDAPYTSDRSRLWMSQGEGVFTDQAENFGIDDTAQGRGIVCADFDNDHDVDILLLLNNADNGAIYWRNDLTDDNSVTLTFDGPRPNTGAVGTRITAQIGDVTQTRVVSIGSNFTSHNPTEQVIGLGSAASIDTLTITWPDGTQIVQSDVSAGQRINFIHPNF